MAAAHGSAKTILILDSDPGVLELLHLVLSDAGFVPLKAASAEQALEISEKQPPPLALIDVDVRGWREVLAKLRGLSPLIRCFLVGAGGESYTAEDLALLGTVRYFSKPFSLSELIRSLEGRDSSWSEMSDIRSLQSAPGVFYTCSTPCPLPAPFSSGASGMIAVVCPHCRSVMISPDSYKGRHAACPNCTRSIQVPEQPMSAEDLQKLLRQHTEHDGARDTESERS